MIKTLDNTMKEVIEYHDNGNISRKYHEDENGMNHGLYQKWYDNGQLWVECHYINGKYHGLFQTWHSNGQPYEKCHYINNKVHGLYQTWHDNGQQYEKCHFINGNFHGSYQRWYENGQLWKEVIYINNEKTDLPIPRTREEKILFKIKHGVKI